MARTKSIAVWIRRKREENGLSQDAVATRIGVSGMTISNWENGKTKPKEKDMPALEKLFGKFASDMSEANDTQDTAISDWLRTSRTSMGMTQMELAKKSKVNIGTISQIETGKITSPQDWAIEALEAALGTEEEEAPPSKESSIGAGLGKFQQFDPHDPQAWPKVDGVYVLYDVSDRATYVGRGKPIDGRIKDHSTRQWFIRPFVSKAAYIPVTSKELRASLETILIKFMQANAMVNAMNVERDRVE